MFVDTAMNLRKSCAQNSYRPTFPRRYGSAGFCAILAGTGIALMGFNWGSIYFLCLVLLFTLGGLQHSHLRIDVGTDHLDVWPRRVRQNADALPVRIPFGALEVHRYRGGTLLIVDFEMWELRLDGVAVTRFYPMKLGRRGRAELSEILYERAAMNTGKYSRTENPSPRWHR